jgi:hypothetical protein
MVVTQTRLKTGSRATWGSTGTVLMKRKRLAAGRAVCVAAAAFVVASCQIPDFNQFQAPKLDINAMIPPDQNQFARKQRTLQPIGPSDLVDGSGTCVGTPAPAVASEQASDPQQTTAAQPPATPPRGIALEMTECEVVRAAGRPAEVQISADQHGERMVIMIFPQPEKPTYRFVAGRLKVVERGAEPPPEQPVSKKPAKKPVKRQAT